MWSTLRHPDTASAKTLSSDVAVLARLIAVLNLQKSRIEKVQRRTVLFFRHGRSLGHDVIVVNA